MEDTRNVCRARHRARRVAAIKASAIEDGEDAARAVERAAARLATEMARAHGGVWQWKVDHLRRFVLVRQT